MQEPQPDVQVFGDSAAVVKKKASEASSAISNGASKLASEAGDAANSARESMVADAAKADAAIQKSIGNGSRGSSN